MKGFDSKWRDVPHFINGITHQIWKDRQIGSLRHRYADGLVARSSVSVVVGNAGIMAATMATLAEFHDRQLLGQDVIWSVDAENATPATGAFLSSHRLICTATQSRPGVYGAPTGRQVAYRILADCAMRADTIYDEWPGSDQKENFTIIGGGVSESPDQYVHIVDKIGFNIGAAGQPAHCRNSLHSHRTAEVFFVLSGRWRFFWGRWGDAGEVVLEPGDIINIPTGIFRGFQNIGTDYGMIMAILGGDDAGGGVLWAPQVIEDARAHGLVLGDNGKLYDSKKGQGLPDGVQQMPLLTDEELKAFPEPTTQDVVPHYVARYLDLLALADHEPARVIGPDAKLRDRPGFNVDFIAAGSAPSDMHAHDSNTVLMPVKGHWRLDYNGGTTTLNPGDTVAVPPGLKHSLAPAMSGEAALYRVRQTDDPAGATWTA